MLDEYLEKNGNIVVPDSEKKCLDVLKKCVEVGYCFRGITDANHHLLSTLDRYGSGLKVQREQYLIREFQRRLHHYIGAEHFPSTTLELLSLMQHYGVPTKLLDFTYSPYVALYFAIYDMNPEVDSAVWSVLPFNLHSRSRKKLDDGGFTPQMRTDAYFSEQFVEQEYFDEAFMNHKYGIAMLLQPERMNERLSIQQGLFLVTDGVELETSADPIKNVGMFKTAEDTVLELLRDSGTAAIDHSATDPTLLKIIIPGSLKVSLMKTLELMNINASSLFPGLDGFGRYIKEKVQTKSGVDMAPFIFGQ